MKIAIYGGTFDPVHNGHLIIAEALIELLALDKMILMPAYIPPHKKKKHVTEFRKRFDWLRRAFEPVKNVEISDYEGRKEDISYTFNTIVHFEKAYGKLLYVIGEDNFLTIKDWYRYEEFLRKVELWVYPRKCNSDITSVLVSLGELSKNVHFAKGVPLIQISSSEIRERIRKGLSIRGYVPTFLEEEVISEYSKGGM